jgi:hypothetical protein
MTIENDSPDWSLLPDDPVGFFGLGPTFDRSSLKRRYGQLIRRFKPEQYPAEFKQIRGAYEMLEGWLRYRPTEELPPQHNGWTTVYEDSIVSSVGTLSEPFHLRAARESPEQLYRELSAGPQKTPADFFALAVLSDLMPSEPKEKFADWVLDGLDQHRTSNSLLHLLHSYLSGPVSTEALPDLLVRAAQHVPELYFFPLTERHWIALLRDAGFACFRDTLAECERHQPGKDIANRVIFYVQILRHAIWEADTAWVEESISFVEMHFRYVQSDLDRDIDLLLELQKYTAVRQEFIGKHPLRREMDSILRIYVAGSDAPGDELMRVFQQKLLDDPAVLGEAFPDFEEPTLSQFYSLWAWISLDSAARNVGELFPRSIDPAWKEAAKNLVLRAQRLATWSGFALKWQLKKVGLVLFMFVGFFAIPILATFLSLSLCFAVFPLDRGGDVAVVFSCVGSVVGGLALSFRFWKYGTQKWIHPIDAAAWPVCYRRFWQLEVLKFMKHTMLPVEDMMRLITITSLINIRDQLNGFIERDYALAFFALAQRFIA